jgi:hypothetical protein
MKRESRSTNYFVCFDPTDIGTVVEWRGMLDVLTRICDEGGLLVSVEYLLFENNPRIVTRMVLRFASISVVCRAVEADDTLALALGSLIPGDDETIVDVSSAAPWSACGGSDVRWAWSLTNQQGYSDGARLEFVNGAKSSKTVVEMIVVASAIQTFVVGPISSLVR